MSSYGPNSDTEGLRQVVIWLVVITAVVILLVVFASQVFIEPEQQRGFEGQVAGLITEYCTAPRQADKEAAKIQLATLTDSLPERFVRISTALSSRAKAVLNNNVDGACS